MTNRQAASRTPGASKTSKSRSTTSGERRDRRETLLYVYAAVAGHPDARVLAALAGMPEGRPPRAIAIGSGAREGISMVASDVPASAYSAAVVEHRLGDLDWVARAGSAHHAVIDAVAEAHDVLPFRLFTLFSSEVAARRSLGDARASLVAALARVRGRQEWVLRVMPPPPPPPGDPPAATTGDRTSAPPAGGTQFLQAKRDARRAEAARGARIKQGVADVFAAIAAVSDAATSRPPQAGETALLDAAFLIDTSRVDAVRETLTRTAAGLLDDGCRVSLTGPWPPYSFAGIEADADA